MFTVLCTSTLQWLTLAPLLQDAFDTLSDPVTRASHDRDLGGPGAGAPPANARSGQWNYGGRAKGYDHPGGNVERPRAAPSGSKSGKIFDKDVWSRMHYNIMKEQDEKEHLLQAAEKLQNVGMPFEKVDMASNKTLYMGTTRTVTKEMTQMDMKKRIKNKLHEKREARIRDKARIDKMDVGGGGGSCVIA